MNAETLVATSIVFPVLMGLASYVAPKNVRKILVILSGLVMAGASILIYNSGGFVYTPNESFELIIVGLDVLLLSYFLLQGYLNKNLPTIGLAIAQIVPVLYFEYMAHGTRVEPTFVVDGISIIMSVKHLPNPENIFIKDAGHYYLCVNYGNSDRRETSFCFCSLSSVS